MGPSSLGPLSLGSFGVRLQVPTSTGTSQDQKDSDSLGAVPCFDTIKANMGKASADQGAGKTHALVLSQRPLEKCDRVATPCSECL